ncbi:hypothetical protein SAMN05519103_08499 [Rhizobiales bacterium GAS113]|nr:hypothetical protein SAMN05519103_08499 [Rhizobiales bacterium GAS113]
MGEANRRKANQARDIPTSPVQRAVEFLYQEVVVELAALTVNNDAYLAARASSESARFARVRELTLLGKAFIDAFRQGAFHDPALGRTSLAEHAQRLGGRYVARLARFDERTNAGSTDWIETPEELQLATDIDTRMRQLESAGMSRKTILAEMDPYMPSLQSLMETLPDEAMHGLCRRFDGLSRYVKFLEISGREDDEG